jgi:hypothetical protein
MKRLVIALALFSSPVFAGSSLTGRYRLSEGPDVAGALDILPDHRFRYMLAAGALDERSEGRWVEQGRRVCLFTEPRPVPPVFALSAMPPAQPQESDLLVTWPNGRGIAGVDFVLGFASGEPLTGYTQLSVPMHNLKSPRIALDGKARVHVVLTPNDLGLVDFQGECLEARDKAFFLRRGGGEMRFIRQAD